LVACHVVNFKGRERDRVRLPAQTLHHTSAQQAACQAGAEWVVRPERGLSRARSYEFDLGESAGGFVTLVGEDLLSHQGQLSTLNSQLSTADSLR
jgi:hypothetical protein